MFDLVQNNKAVQLAFKILLGGVTIGLVVSYGTVNFSVFGNSQPPLAKVGDKTIDAHDLGNEIQRLGQQDADKSQVLQMMVNNDMTDQDAAKVGIVVTDPALKAWVGSIPDFQKNGKFDPATMEQVLQQHNLTPDKWEPDARRGAERSELLLPTENTMVSPALKQKLVAVVGAQRQIASAKVEAKDFVATAQVSDADMKAYYQAHLSEFKIADQVKLQYLELSPDALAGMQTVSDSEAHAYFNLHKDQLAVEERKSRHILILAGKTPAEDQQAKARAEQILQQLQKNPDQFAAIAKAQSQDPGSADKGGELPGWYVQRGQLDQAFADALFKLQPKQLSPVVRSQFGYHVIQLLDSKQRSFEEAQASVVDLVKKEKATKSLADASSKLADLTLSNIKSLDPAAKALGLQVKTSDWVIRGAKGIDPLLSNPKLQETVFSLDAIKSHQNTDVIDLDNNEQVVARVVDYQPAHVQTLAEVTAMLKLKLKSEAAAKLAVAQGTQFLADLQKGGQPALKWSAVRPISRGEASMTMSPEEATAVFNTPLHGNASTYLGIKSTDGYVLYRVSPAAEAVDKTAGERITMQLRGSESQAEGIAYRKSMEDRIKPQLMATKDQAQ